MNNKPENLCDHCFVEQATRDITQTGLRVCQDCYDKFYTCTCCASIIDSSDLVYDGSGVNLCIDCEEGME